MKAIFQGFVSKAALIIVLLALHIFYPLPALRVDVMSVKGRLWTARYGLWFRRWTRPPWYMRAVLWLVALPADMQVKVGELAGRVQRAMERRRAWLNTSNVAWGLVHGSVRYDPERHGEIVRRSALSVGMAGAVLLFIVAGALAMPHANEYAQAVSDWARASLSQIGH